MTIQQAFEHAIQHQNSGRLAEAEAIYRQILAVEPRHADSLHMLGAIAGQTERNDLAVDLIRQSIALKPGFALAHSNLGNALSASGKLEEAVAAYRQAIALEPGLAMAHSNLGNALRDTGKLDDAFTAYRQAIALQPGYADAFYNFGIALRDAGKLDEAIGATRQAIALRPGFADAHNNLAHLLLSRGDCIEGWEENEWRWKTKDFAGLPRNHAQPEWKGGPLEGRTILLQAEQGIGDAIQFIRYLPMVLQQGGRVILQCQPGLKRLYQLMAPDLLVLEGSQPLPAFDTHCPLLSLPRLFATDLSSIPQNVPYLHANPEEAGTWRARLAEHSHSLKVGLVWAGNPRFKADHLRSPRQLSLYAPLGGVERVQFFSLQKGEAASQCRTPQAGMVLHDWSDELRDFADTAALMENLDVVVTSDTSVAHLAGAMGKRVWVMLPFSADWRWLRDRSDSPWYPTMRLFRQSRPTEWEPVVAEVRGQLEELVRSREREGRSGDR